MEHYYAACCQLDQPNPRNRDEMAASTSRILAQLERAVVGYRPFHDIKLVVFPEFGHAAPIYPTAEELADKLAISADNEHVDRLRAAAGEHGVWIQSASFLEIDERYRDALFNTTLLIGPDGEVHSRYRKVNPWIPWEVSTSPHDIEGYDEEMFPVAETDIGRIGVATCYDWLFPETCRELTLGGAEILVRISAYMDPWGATEPMDWWTIVNRCRAIENMSIVVACNQGASASHYPPFSWPGASMAIDWDGRILAQAPAGPGEATVVAPVALGALRQERRRRAGHSMASHLRSEAYPRQRQQIFPPNGDPGERTAEGLEGSIDRSKRRLGW